MKRSFVLFMMVMAFHISTQAQTDPIFTQYMNSMQTVNPAYAGMWDKVGVQAFTRRYYVGHDRAPLTKSVIFYSPIKNENNGIGLDIIDDRIGYEKRLTVTADYAFQVRLDWKTYLRLGLKAGFINYDNLLTQYKLYPDGIDDPLFMEDVHINFMVSWGIGAMVYSKDYYISFSIPQIIDNGFQANRNNYSSLAELRYAYLIGGYIFGKQRQIRFKPSLMVKGAIGAPVQADISANVQFYNKFWVGAMYRTNNTVAAVMQIRAFKNIKLGYAVDYSITQEFQKYQLGTHEIRVIYEYDFYKRPYTRRRFF
ncbi:PorP/SprF family type IX secretion system membrane protein [Sunxiuqinia indica]|uniref:PorP/SprF family type IX secretion system membrane protein n=1 Tax=Sunxiuqinia indica TaxID=2692584 RepID=UPI001357340A|nr:PorP/SprF family type IX secretion system membrane protein [Sunxiuqinia indica]